MQPYGQQSYGAPQQQQYGQQYGEPQQSYGGEQYGSPQEQYGAPPPQQQGRSVLSQVDFLQRVAAIRADIDSLRMSISNIATLHQQTLASSDNGARQQLDDLVAATQLKNTSIRSQIQQLKADTERTTDSNFAVKKRQFDSLNDYFRNTIQTFLEEEQQYKQRYREQIARQYRIVNPEATEEQVQQAADADWGDEGIFQTAVRFRLFFASPLSQPPKITSHPPTSSEPTAPAKPQPCSATCARATTTCSRSKSPSWSSWTCSRCSTSRSCSRGR
jgi:syntaxin 1B/2/3